MFFPIEREGRNLILKFENTVLGVQQRHQKKEEQAYI
jgi:hypothetical protein